MNFVPYRTDIFPLEDMVLRRALELRVGFSCSNGEARPVVRT